MKKLARLVLALCITASFLTLHANAVLADLIGFDLNNVNIGGVTGPFVHVDVNRTSSTQATITFSSLTNGGNIYLMGDGSSAAVNINAANFSVAPPTGTQLPGFNAPTYTIVNPPSTSNVDGWGLFNLTIDSSDGFTESSNQIQFIVTNNSGTWASASNVLGGANPNIAASHIFPCNVTGGCLASEGVNGSTGFASGTGTSATTSTQATQTPEPSTLFLLGSGLLFLAKAARRKFRS